MKETLKNIGSVLLGICFILFIFALPVLFIKGGLWLAPIVLPWLNLISGITFLVCLLILLPLSAFKKTRSFAGIGLFSASYVFGMSLWFSGFLLTYLYWGGLALVIGLFIAGIGVVPIAMLASALHGDWSIFIGLLLSAFFTFGARMLGSHLVEKAENEKQKAWLIDVEGTATSSTSA
jgi:hypothetical protein